ncbi:MAG: protein translocase subunit SecF [Spirochaetaceae bacterium]
MRQTIQFTKIRYLTLAISAALIVAGIVATVLRGGFNLGIDFEAGLAQTVRIETTEETEAGALREILAEEIGGVQVTRIGDTGENTFSVRVSQDEGDEEFTNTVSTQVEELLEARYGAGNVETLETNFVESRFSRDLARQAILLTAFALVLILVYIWFRFQFGYAVAAIAALVHDTAFMVFVIGTIQMEVTTATIAAVLTIIGYSLNDTIVVFDRIRENESLMREASYEHRINTSITQSLGRTIITSLTTFLAVLAIYIFARGTVQDFALALMVGVVVGTYSSVFVASPTLLLWQRKARERAKKKDMERYGPAPAPAEEKVPVGGEKPPADAAVDVDAVKREISKKKSPASGSRSVSRAKRKGKK